MRSLALILLLASAPALAGIKVPADVGVGPAGFWFAGPLFENRGWIPHFAITLNVHAVIDKDWVQENYASIPPKYRSMADSVNEVRIGPSIFIPQTIYISPKLDALGGAGMYGATWAPLGLTLINTGQKSARDWNRSRGRFYLDAQLLLTYLFIHSDFPGIPATHFVRPGLQLRATLQFNVTEKLLISLGGGAQAYVPQRLGSFFEVTPIDQTVWFAGFAFLKLHFRFPYEITL